VGDLAYAAASIALAMHNSAWGLMIAFTATSYPVLVNSYLLGDSGILITSAPPREPCWSAG